MGEQSSESRVVGPLDRGGDGEALEDLHLLDQRQCLLRHAALGDRVRSVLVGQPHHLDDVVVAQAPDRSRFGTFSISGVLRRRTAAAITAVGAAADKASAARIKPNETSKGAEDEASACDLELTTTLGGTRSPAFRSVDSATRQQPGHLLSGQPG
jgi:hypothetical protein